MEVAFIAAFGFACLACFALLCWADTSDCDWSTCHHGKDLATCPECEAAVREAADQGALSGLEVVQDWRQHRE